MSSESVSSMASTAANTQVVNEAQQQYTRFLDQLDSINIDPNFGNANDKVKTHLRGLLQPHTNLMSRVLNEASEKLTTLDIDRLAKIAFAFSPDTNNTYAQRATVILGNALQKAGPQTAFHISARLEQIGTNAAQDAIAQASNRPQYRSPYEEARRQSEEDIRVLSDFRRENGSLDTPNSDSSSSDPKLTTSEIRSRSISKMLHEFRSGY
jgi:hypothetical protein